MFKKESIDARLKKIVCASVLFGLMCAGCVVMTSTDGMFGVCTSRAYADQTVLAESEAGTVVADAVDEQAVVVISPSPEAEGVAKTEEGERAASSYKTRAANGWYHESTGWYFYDNGVRVKNAWLMDSIDWCWVGSDGRAFQNQWGYLHDSSGWNWYYFDNNTRITRNKWQRDSVAWCYLDSNAHALRNTWAEGLNPYGNFMYLWFDGDCHAKRGDLPWDGYI